jgi:plastocyanin
LQEISRHRSRAVGRGAVSAVIIVVIIIAAATYLYLNPPPAISGSTQSSQSTQLYTYTNYGATTSASLATSSATGIPANAVYVYMPADGGYPFSQYTPQVITVIIGVNNTVVWVNQDVLVHNAISQTGAFSSGDISPGASFVYTFTQAGTFPYYCSYHPSMAGVIIVRSS